MKKFTSVLLVLLMLLPNCLFIAQGSDYVKNVCQYCGSIGTLEIDYRYYYDPPTCTSEGYGTLKCSSCPHTTLLIEPALGHNYTMTSYERYDEYICSRCSHFYREVYVPYTYTLTEDGAVIADYVGTEKELVIPDTIDGHKVVGIGENVFKDNTRLFSITIPDSVTAIGNYAFYGCTKLSTINLSKELTSIGNYCFSGCSELDTIKLPDSLTTIGTFAFYGCTYLSSPTLPQALKDIGKYAFYKCRSINKILIPSGVTTINEYTFGECSFLKEVTLSQGVKEINSYAFYECPVLEKVTIPDSVTQIYEEFIVSCPKAIIYTPSYSTCRSYCDANDLEFIATDTVAITVTPIKTVYLEGDSFQDDHIVVTAHFENGKSEVIKNYKVENILGKLTPGEKTAIVSYYNSSTTYNIFVEEKSIRKIDVRVVKKFYYEYDEFNASDIEVRVYYNNKTEEVTSNYSMRGFDTSAIGFKTITINHADFDYDYEIVISHKWEDTYTIKEATCTQVGEKLRTCAKCGDTVIEKFGGSHIYTSQLTLDYPATCTEDGQMSQHCTVCDEFLPISVVPIKATGHSYKTVTIPETCTIYGKIIQTCKECDNTIIQVVPATGHKLEYTQQREHLCFTCTECQESYNQKIGDVDNSGEIDINDVTYIQKLIAKTIEADPTITILADVNRNGRIDIRDVASIQLYLSNLAQDLPYQRNNYGYEILADGSAKLISYAVGNNDKEIVIPETIDGYKVTVLGNSLFKENNIITSVKIPEGIKKIEPFAFRLCINLEEIEIPHSVTTLGKYSFYDCINLKKVVIGNGVTAIGQGAFYNCESLKDITFGAGVTALGKLCFTKCFYLTELTIPGNIKTLNTYAVSSCDLLQSVTLEEGVETIGDYAFAYDGWLKKIVIPESVTSISENAFIYASDDFTIYCYDGSFAHTYAKNNNISYVLLD